MVKTLADFTKKKVKVGRKIPRANESKIKVKSKKIRVPLQATILAEGNKDDREVLIKIIKQLHHYSEPHRVQALVETKNFLATCNSPDSHIAQLFPEMMALLFKEDHETRDALVESITYSMQRLKAESFVPVMSLLVSYLCSGLTHVNKSIRRDSLQILLVILEKGAWLVSDQMDQLLQHIIMIIQDRTLPLLLNTSSTNANNKKVKLSMFQLTLKVIRSLVHVQYKSSSADQITTESSLLQLQSNPAGSSTESFGMVLLRGRKLVANVSAKSTAAISLDMRVKFLERLSHIWRDMAVTEDNLVALNTVEALREIAKVLLVLIRMPMVDAGVLSGVHQRVVETLFQGFPFTCQETAVACPGSAMEIHSKLQAGLLNIEVCEIAFHHIMSRGLENHTQFFYQQVRQHMMEVLQDCLLQLTLPGANDFHSEIAQKIFSCSSLFTFGHAESLAMLRTYMGHVGDFLLRVPTSSNSTIPRAVLTSVIRSLSELAVHTAAECKNQRQHRHAKALFTGMLNVTSHAAEVVVKCNLTAPAILAVFVDALKQILQQVGNEMLLRGEESSNLLVGQEGIDAVQSLYFNCTKLFGRDGESATAALNYSFFQLPSAQRHHMLSLLSLLPGDNFSALLRGLLDPENDIDMDDEDITVLFDLLGYRLSENDAVQWNEFSMRFLHGYFAKCISVDAAVQTAITRAQRMSCRVADFIVSNSCCIEFSRTQATVHKVLLEWQKELHPIVDHKQQLHFWMILNSLIVFARRFTICHYLYPAVTADEQISVAKWEDLLANCFQTFARSVADLDNLENHEQIMMTVKLLVDMLGSEYLYAKRTQMFFDLLQSLLKLFGKKQTSPSDILHYVPLIRLLLHRIILQSSTEDVFKYQSALNVWLASLKQQYFSKDEDIVFYDRLHVDLVSCF